jgi:hypothetical protein
MIKNHFTKKPVFKLIEDISKREKIKVVNFEKYILPVTYSSVADSIIINLKPYDVDEISDLSPNNLYALLVYGYCFSKLVKRVKIGDQYADLFVKYFLSLFIKVFGKEYGLLGIYSKSIPKLKFLIACYVLSSFFDYRNDNRLYKKASSIATYPYLEEKMDLINYDFSDISKFIKALSDFKVMPGIKIYGFTAKLHRFLGVEFLPALEDLSRCISILLTSDIRGANIVRSFLYKYNEKVFNQIIELSKGVFK